MGSCFAEEMAAKFARYQFTTALNSHGILFHPLALCRAIDQLVQGDAMRESSVVFDQGKWHSFDFHGRFSADTKEYLIAKASNSLQEHSAFLSKASWLIITWGTAHGYVHESAEHVVSNCHKIPQQQFHKVLTKHQEIEQAYEQLFSNLKAKFPNLNVLLTVSPVKYLKDGFSGNQLSKAHLQIAAHHLSQRFDWVSYFPSFELVTDDLRDYRFYKSDLVHPNDLAIAYVWDKLATAALSDPALSAMKQMEPLLLQLEHRPRHSPFTDAEKRAKKEAIEKIVASSILSR
jgi:hypothetical protein